MLTRILKASNLVTAPPDEIYTSRTRRDVTSWVYGFNFSPFCFELLREDGGIEMVLMPFAPFKHVLMVQTEKLILHASSAAMVPASPLAAADLAVYIGISEFEPDLIPGPW